MNRLKESLQKTEKWFRESGVMTPPDGSWGVAERVLVTENNPAVEKVYASFPAWTEHDGYSIIEQRRSDCCFEVAFMFQQMAVALNDPEAEKTAYKLLDFLYRRSGLLSRKGDHPSGWTWSHISERRLFWFDDNAWVCILQLMIGRATPEWDREFAMTEWAVKLADDMATGFQAQFGKEYDPAFIWHGNLKLPHWGSLPVMAFARAWEVNQNPQYREIADIYHRYLLECHQELTTSEFGYAVLGATMTHKIFNDDLSLEVATLFADKILDRMDPETGCIPAEHHEAPSGPHLADTIYTLNWAILALQNMVAATGQAKYREGFDKLLALLLKIQDHTPKKQLFGCWRGMYDLNVGAWGGGDCYEGGAGSIYTGWTNAPIAWAFLNELNHKSLLDY